MELESRPHFPAYKGVVLLEEAVKDDWQAIQPFLQFTMEQLREDRKDKREAVQQLVKRKKIISLILYNPTPYAAG